MSNEEEKKKPTLLSIKRRLHGMRRVFFLSLALIIVIAGYFHFVGFPQWAIRKLENKLAERNLYVAIENVKLDFYYGFEAQQVTVYKSILQRKPLLTAERLAFYLSGRELFRHGHLLAHRHVGDARVLPALLPPEVSEFFPAPLVKELDADWRNGKLSVQSSEIRWGKLWIHAAGELFYDHEGIGRAQEQETAASDKLRLFMKGLHDSLRLKDTAELDIQFSLNTILPERSALTARLDGARLLLPAHRLYSRLLLGAARCLFHGFEPGAVAYAGAFEPAVTGTEKRPRFYAGIRCGRIEGLPHGAENKQHAGYSGSCSDALLGAVEKAE